MSKTSRIVATAVLIVSTAATAVIGASPAQAATCTKSVTTPYRVGNNVATSASVSSGCPSGSYKVELRRTRVWGWDDLKDGYISVPPGGSIYLPWGCSGTGTYDYYTVIIYGSYIDTKSRTARLTC